MQPVLPRKLVGRYETFPVIRQSLHRFGGQLPIARGELGSQRLTRGLRLDIGNNGQAGIYLASTLTKVIAVGDTLKGQVVTELRLGEFGFDGNRLSFAATFANGSQGVFVFTVTPSPEICDGFDNNFDETVDEGFNVGAACSVGVGACQRTGVQVCTATGAGTQCNATAGTPGVEICGNGIDEDCDGADSPCSPPPGDACLITTVLDTFNRADGNVGNNWRGATDTAFYRIVSNRLDVQVGGPLFWNPTAFGANQAAFVTLSTVDAKGPAQGVLLKVQNGSVPDAGAISVVYDATAKAVRVSTLRLGALAWTSYGNTAVPFTNGDKLGACAKANGEVRVYKNDTLVKTVTLSAADQGFFDAKGGKVGMWTALASQAFLDTFGGATITP